MDFYKPRQAFERWGYTGCPRKEQKVFVTTLPGSPCKRYVQHRVRTRWREKTIFPSLGMPVSKVLRISRCPSSRIQRRGIKHKSRPNRTGESSVSSRIEFKPLLAPRSWWNRDAGCRRYRVNAPEFCAIAGDNSTCLPVTPCRLYRRCALTEDFLGILSLTSNRFRSSTS